MRCDEVQEFLDLREMGEAQPSADVDGHLKGCAECTEFAADLQFAASSFAAVPMERFPEAKSRELMSKISALEAERAEEAEEASSGGFAAIFESLARLVAGPRLAYGLGMAAVMMAVIVKLQSGPAEIEVAQNPVVTPAPVVPVTAPVTPPALRKHAVEIASGQVLLSGILMGSPGHTTHIDVPEGRSLSTLAKQSAVLQLADGTKVAMGSATTVAVADKQLYLDSGQVGVHVQKGGQGFRTHAPKLTTFVMGTRYIAGEDGVELVEGKVEVSADGDKAVLKPGEKAGTDAGKVGVKPISQRRMRSLYSFFGNLDGRDGLAKDLGMTVAQLDDTIAPPVPTVPAPPTIKPAAPPAASGPVRVTPGMMPTLPDPDDAKQD